MERLFIAIAEAALELVPEELLGERDVISSARRLGKDPTRMLLDISLHYRSMRRRLRDWYRRGRPDIVHTTLLVASSSPLWRRGMVSALVETRHGLLFVREGVRIPRSFSRFAGLVEQVLSQGSAPPGSEKPLIWLEKIDLVEYLKRKSPDYAVILHEKGLPRDPEDLGRRAASSKNPHIIVGGFQRGDFSQRILGTGLERVSIGRESLEAWGVVCRVLAAVEKSLSEGPGLSDV